MPQLNEKELKKEEQRQRIMDAAIRAFARKGYYGTTMDDIVKESGLSKGTLYWYFENKKQLFQALLERDVDEGKAEIVEVMQRQPDLISKFRALFETYIFLNEPPDQFDENVSRRVTVEYWQQAIIDPEFREIYVKNYYEFWMDFGLKLFQEAREKGEIADLDEPAIMSLIMVVFDGLLLQWLVDLNKVGIERTFKGFLFLLEKGLKKS
jgi:AcrR family transcriptional regulator